MNRPDHLEQGTVAPGSALRSGLIPRWYRYALVTMAAVLILVAVLAGGAFREASIQSCQGTNETKMAVTQIVDQLYDASQIPSSSPDIQAARDAQAERYLKLQDGFHDILKQDECGSLLPWDIGD